jgi:hypothetical protein
MSQPASADDSTEIESDTTDSESGQQSLNEGLQQVRESVTERLKKIDDDGEQIKRIVGHAIVGDRTDSDVTVDLRQEITNHIGDIHNSHDAVTLNEITVALWAELYRVSEMAVEASENNDENKVSGADDSEDEEKTVKDDSETNSQSSIAFADGGSAPETPPTETDPAFQ